MSKDIKSKDIKSSDVTSKDVKSEDVKSYETDFNDQLVVSQIVSGQKDLFRLLVRQYERAVYGMGISFFRNKEDASDFTQEVFLKAYRSLSRFEGRSRFSTWLYKIAYNTAINEVNRRKEYHSLAEENMDRLSNSGDTPERIAIKGAAIEAVQAAVKDLPERFRLCVDLYFHYDRSHQEIETITGYPVNTIKSHVFRAKKMLREKLEHLKEAE